MTILGRCRLKRESKKYQARSLAGHSGSQILVLGTLGLLTLSFTPFGRSSHHPMHVSMMCAFMFDISMIYVSLHRRIPTFAEHHQVLPISKIISTSEEGAAVAWFNVAWVCAQSATHASSILLAKFPPAGLLKSIWENKGDIIICYLLQTLSSLRSSGALMLSSSPHSFDHNGQCFCVSVFLLPKIFFVGTIAISWSLWPISVIWITPSRWTKRYRCNHILL